MSITSFKNIENLFCEILQRKKLRTNLQMPIFKIVVGWCLKKVLKVPFFGSDGTLCPMLFY